MPAHYLVVSAIFLTISCRGSANQKITLNEVLTAPFPPEQQFWFLGTLFIIMVLSAPIIKLKNSFAIWIGLFTIFLIGRSVYTDQLFLMTSDNSSTNILAQAIIHFPYFVLGIICGSQALKKLPYHTAFCIITFFLCIFAYLSFNQSNVFLTFLLATGCIFSIYKFFLNVESSTDGNNKLSRFMIFIGMNSMIIYLAHVIASGGTRAILLKMNITYPEFHLFMGTLAGLLMPLMLVPIGLWLRNYLPRISPLMFPVRSNRATSSQGRGYEHGQRT